MKTFKEIIDSINMDETPEKYQCFKDEIVQLLFSTLEKLVLLEKETYNKNEEDRKRCLEKFGNKNTIDKEHEKIFEDFKNCYGDIVKPVCTDALLKYYAGSFGKPAKYDYPNQNCRKVSFIMKSEKKASIEIYYHTMNYAHKFIFTKNDNKWKIGEVFSSLDAGGNWSKARI